MASAQLSSSFEVSTSVANVHGYADSDTGAVVGQGDHRAEPEGTSLPALSRHLLTIACLVGTDAKLELEWHTRKALRDGCQIQEIQQVLSLLAIYCDTAAAVSALSNAQQIVDTWADKPDDG